MNLGPSVCGYSYNWARREHVDSRGNVVSYGEVYNNYLYANIKQYYNTSSLYGFFDYLAIVRTYEGNILGLAGSFGGKITGVQDGLFTVANGGSAAMIATGNMAVESWGGPGKSVFADTKVYALDFFDLKDGAAFTLPGIGIFTGSKYTQDVDLLRHEYGHILQAKKWGYFKYYTQIMPKSFIKATYATYFNNSYDYMSYWTEWSANHMSYNYFNQPKWNNDVYPILPTTFRNDNFPSSVSGPFDFKFNWLDK